ncbi:hypothetical protein ACFV7R_46475 [Streptomyces sp. NPDC059866]|uniref:hypothetical protein n=1 Tax=Streptomyces sp. NPDC059866 TaxID=3346978 RepID=UPI003661C41C
MDQRLGPTRTQLIGQGALPAAEHTVHPDDQRDPPDRGRVDRQVDLVEQTLSTSRLDTSGFDTLRT